MLILSDKSNIYLAQHAWERFGSTVCNITGEVEIEISNR